MNKKKNRGSHQLHLRFVPIDIAYQEKDTLKQAECSRGYPLEMTDSKMGKCTLSPCTFCQIW